MSIASSANEATTRAQVIDTQLAQAGWSKSRRSLVEEFVVMAKEAFYEKAFRAGLPYLEDGTPTTTGGVTYAQFVRAFRDRHRLNPHPDAREVCVLCGGPLGETPPVDHWIAKSEFPRLSMCKTNLTLVWTPFFHGLAGR